MIKLLSSILMISLSSFAVAGAMDDAMAAHKSKQFRKSYEIALPLAEAGDSAALFHIGMMHLNGQGVVKDESKAFTWIKRSANDGNMRSLFRLAEMHRDGIGTNVDLEMARYQFRRILFGADERVPDQAEWKAKTIDALSKMGKSNNQSNAKRVS